MVGRRVGWMVVAMALLPLGVGAQERGPSVSLDLTTGEGLPRLGVWTWVGDRLQVGLEAESDFRSWTRFPDGDPDRAVSGTDWRFAAGPSVRLRLASTGAVTFFAHAGLTYGQHRFPAWNPADPMTAATEAERSFAFRPGVGLEWAVSDRLTLGAIYSARWLSGESPVEGLLHDPWRPPRLGFTLRFSF